MKKYVFLILLPSLLGFLTQVSIAEAIPYKIIGNWTVAMDPSMGNGCFIEMIYTNQAKIRLGYDNRNNASTPIYLAAFSPDWGAIEDGKDYDVTWQLDNNNPWKSTAFGTTFESKSGIFSPVGAVDFIAEFARKRGLKLFFNGTFVIEFDLSNSDDALPAMLECQKVIDGVSVKPKKEASPFAPARRAKDPLDL